MSVTNQIQSTYNGSNLVEKLEEEFRFGDAFFYSLYSNLTAKPELKTVILTCMDCRITARSLGILKPGKVIILRNAGALFTYDILRSLLIAIYELDIKFIAVIGHTNCGNRMSEDEMDYLLQKMAKRLKVHKNQILRRMRVDNPQELFHGFRDIKDQVVLTVSQIKSHPLIPKDIVVKPYLYHTNKGKIFPLS